MSGAPVLARGSMTKRSRWLRVWRERHFTLVGTQLRFHKASDARHHGSIECAELRTLPTDADVPGREHCFVVQTRSGKTYALQARSSNERSAWKQVIAAAKFLPRLQAGCKVRKHGALKSRDVFLSLSADATRLCYHDWRGASPSARSNEKEIPMAAVTGVRDLGPTPGPGPGADGGTAFAISDGSRAHRVDAGDAAEKRAWVQALQQAVVFRRAAAALCGFGPGHRPRGGGGGENGNSTTTAQSAEAYATQQQARNQRAYLASVGAARESERAEKKAFRNKMRAKYGVPPGD